MTSLAEMVQDGTTELVGKLHLFSEDVVESASQPGLLGSVVSYSGDPGSDSEEDYSEDEQEEEVGDAPSNETCAEVLWLTAAKSVGANVAELRVVDRTLTHNNVVSWALSPLGQMGKVVYVSILMELEMEDGTTTQQVDSKTVTRVRSIATGDVVVKGPWVGRVASLEENVIVVFNDGAKCKIMEADPAKLMPNPSVDDDEEFPYYPGQKVRAKSAKTFKRATWLSGSWNSNMLDATVVEVETAVVDIKWIWNQQGFDGMGNSRAPEEEQKPEGLSVLAPFSYAEWGLGDRCIHSNSVGRIVNIKTKADVLWQNGDTSYGVDSCELIHSKPPKENDFWPGQFVRERIIPSRAKYPQNGVAKRARLSEGRDGVVKRINSEARSAAVLWMKSGVGDEEEVVDTHRIDHKPEEADQLGDLVFRCSPKSASGDGSQSQQPWVGCILAFSIEGEIEVIWHDGSVSSVKRSEVKVQAYEDSEDSDTDSESDSESESE